MKNPINFVLLVLVVLTSCKSSNFTTNKNFSQRKYLDRHNTFTKKNKTHKSILDIKEFTQFIPKIKPVHNLENQIFSIETSGLIPNKRKTENKLSENTEIPTSNVFVEVNPESKKNAKPNKQLKLSDKKYYHGDYDIYALLSFAFGITAFFYLLIPIVSILTPFLAIAGIITGIYGLRSERLKSLAIAGLTMSITWVVLALLAIYLIFLIFVSL